MVNSSTFQNKQIPFSTGICSGNVTDNLLNGICANGQGLPTSPYVTYNVTPLTAQVNNVALSQSVLNETTLVLTAGTGVTLITDPNSPYFGCLELDCPRALQFIIGSTGAPNIANITIDGYPGFSSYTRRTQEQITTTTTAGQIFYTNKTYRFVKSITVSGGVGTGGTVSVGTSDILGLPFFVKSPQDIVSKKWLMLGGTFALTNTTPVVVSPSGVPAGASITLADVELDREQTILVSPNPIGYFTITATTNTSFSVTVQQVITQLLAIMLIIQRPVELLLVI